MTLPPRVHEVLEHLGHTFGIHGMRSAVIASLFLVALFLASYSVTSMILEAMGLHRKRR